MTIRTMPHTQVAELLPVGLASAVEAACGAVLAAVKPRGGGGASREGAELALRFADGRQLRAYMSYDTRRAGAGDDAAFQREAAVLQALSGPLCTTGVRVARFIAALPAYRALISEFVSGEADFNKLATAQDRTATARDFMRQLALLHAHDPLRQPIEGFGELPRVRDVVRENLEKFRGEHLSHARQHPLILLTLDWLARNVPDDPDRIVIVHGDAGPANFLYEDNRVTSMVDWELVHYGDAMEDLAMLCLRNLFQPFIALPDAFAAYQAAGGVRVDLDRVRFYRLYYQVRFASSLFRLDDPDAAAPPVLGMNVIYGTIHLRVLNEALAEMMGVKLNPVSLPGPAASAYDRSFEVALTDLRDVIVPRLPDQQASAKAKGLARLIKWWRAIQRFGSTFEALERAEYSRVWGRTFVSAQKARQFLCEQIVSGAVAPETAVQLCNLSTSLDRALLADAMGGLAATRFAPLD